MTFLRFVLDWWGQTFDKPDSYVALFTGFLFVSTVALWWSTRGLQIATNESIKLARKEFLSTHRPRIILREAYTLDLRENEEVRIFLHFANIGESDGTIICSQVWVQTLSSDRVMLNAPLDENFDAFGRISLKPGEAKIIELPYGAPTWRDEMFRAKSNLTTPASYRFDNYLHLVGQFMYRDELETKRRTAFRRELNPDRRRFYVIKDEPDMEYSD